MAAQQRTLGFVVAVFSVAASAASGMLGIVGAQPGAQPTLPVLTIQKKAVCLSAASACTACYVTRVGDDCYSYGKGTGNGPDTFKICFYDSNDDAGCGGNKATISGCTGTVRRLCGAAGDCNGASAILDAGCDCTGGTPATPPDAIKCD